MTRVWWAKVILAMLFHFLSILTSLLGIVDLSPLDDN